MKIFLSCLLIMILFFAFQAEAQVAAPAPGGAKVATRATTVETDMVSAGLGAGLDFGGFGANLIVYPHQNIGAFLGVGYALAGVGYNLGIKGRILSSKGKVNPYLLAMYGYNTAIWIVDAPEWNELFSGPTFGIGLDIGPKPGKAGYWSLSSLSAIRVIV